jgi:hypothetical protein
MSTGENDGIAWGISAGSLHWSTCGMRLGHQNDPIAGQYPSTPAPAAVLLGWAPGETPRLDCWHPPHPRGTAMNWPLDAIVTPENGSGRFPLAAAWTGRLQERTWSWKPDNDERRMTSLEAICVGAAGLASLHTLAASRAIVIPNDFKQREQQRLLDSFRRKADSDKDKDSLIWLPVAAVLAWLQDNYESLPDPCSESPQQLTIVVVHADWGSIRCSTLNLVPYQEHQAVRWMPARGRPAVSDWTTAGFGWMSTARCDSTNAAAVWHTLFASGSPRDDCAQTSDSHLLQQIPKWPVQQFTPYQVDSDLAAHMAGIETPEVIIFVGDFAREVSSGPRVSRLLKSIDPVVADGLEGERLLARGAATFARDRLERRTSYLDTLPTLELFVDRNSRYDWLSLLGTSEQFVAGGQEWTLPTPIEGLAVRRGASSIKLVVAHDEYQGVRELQIQLDRPAETDLAASLQVHATPAQGNARLTLTTQATGGTPSRTILANWERMTQLFEEDRQTPLSKQKFEQTRPKSFPNIRPRPADRTRWTTFARCAKRFLTAVQQGARLSNRSAGLQHLLTSTRVASGLSAVSSEGCAPPPSSNQAIVDDVAHILFDYLRTRPPSGDLNDTQSQAIKTLAFMSVSLDGLDDWISKLVDRPGNLDLPFCMIAGNCIRTPETARFFINQLLSHIPLSNRQRLLNYQMQSLGRMLSQRQDIMSTINDSTAYALVRECLKVFEDELARNNLAWLFENSGLVVVYSLRYRIHNPEFLEPDSDLAIRAKGKFEEAIEHLSHRLQKPAKRYGQNKLSPDRIKRLMAELQKLIDYIDKRGEGDILLAADE